MNPARRAPEGAADRLRAFRRAKALGEFKNNVGAHCLRRRWAQGSEIRREKHGVSFVVSSFVVRQLLPKPNKTGTKIDHKWDQSGPRGERGSRKSTKL